jgi:hypothetical protein
MAETTNSFDAGLDVSKVIANKAVYDDSSNTAGSNSLGTWLALKDVHDHTIAEVYGFSRKLQDASETALQNDPDVSFVGSGLETNVSSVRDRWVGWTVKAAQFLPEGFDEDFINSYVDKKRMSLNAGSTAALTGDNTTVEAPVEENRVISPPRNSQLTSRTREKIDTVSG